MQPTTDYRFSREHTWVKPASDTEALIGVTPFAQEQLGEIVYAELPTAGTSFAKDQVFGSIEALKTTSDLFMPVGGTIVAINDQLKDKPTLVNDDPMGEGWLIRVRLSDTTEPDTLMDKATYEQFTH